MNGGSNETTPHVLFPQLVRIVYVPDVIIRLKTKPVVSLILEAKGFEKMWRAVPKVRAFLDQFV